MEIILFFLKKKCVIMRFSFWGSACKIGLIFLSRMFWAFSKRMRARGFQIDKSLIIVKNTVRTP